MFVVVYIVIYDLIYKVLSFVPDETLQRALRCEMQILPKLYNGNETRSARLHRHQNINVLYVLYKNYHYDNKTYISIYII